VGEKLATIQKEGLELAVGELSSITHEQWAALVDAVGGPAREEEQPGQPTAEYFLG
jgi:hypothetical protein